MQALKRLQQETTAELVQIEDRLDELLSAPSTSSAGRTAQGTSPMSASTQGRPKHSTAQLSGTIELGAGVIPQVQQALNCSAPVCHPRTCPPEFLLVHVQDNDAKVDVSDVFSDGRLGLKLGSDVSVTLSGQPRGGRDFVQAQATVSQVRAACVIET